MSRFNSAINLTLFPVREARAMRTSASTSPKEYKGAAMNGPFENWRLWLVQLRVVIRWNHKLLAHLNLVRVAEFVAVCIKDAHVLIGISIKLFADFGQRIA